MPGVYINEDLTRHRSKCLGLLLFLKKNHHLHSAWSHDGRISYRLAENGPVKQTNSIQEIRQNFLDANLPDWIGAAY
jgi:hypothetical protein